jgi:MFS family permease
MNIAKLALDKFAGSKPFEPADIAEWRNGWRIVLGAAIGLGTGIGLYLLVASFFIKRITAEFGWTRGDMGDAGMVAFVVGAVALPLLGRVLDRFGFRRVVLVCAPCLCLLYLAIATQPGSYAFYLALMVWGGIFGGGTGAMVYTRPVVANFQRQRGLALGVATAGTSIAALIVPSILAVVVASFGWRAGYYVLIVITLFIGLPLALFLIGNAKEGAARATDEVPDETHVTARDATVAEALRSTPFWLLAIALMAINIPGSGVVGQLAPMISDKGMSDATVAIVMSIYAAGLMVGRVVTGFSLDRMQPALVAAVTTFIPAIGVLMLLIPTSSFAVAAIAVALMGIQQGSEVDLLAYFISRNFGLKYYSSIYGLIAVAGASSTATALVFFGNIHDITGSYDIALWVGAMGFLVGTAAFASLSRVRAARIA